MAKLFWLHERDAIAAALVANALLRAMSHRTENKEIIVQMTSTANQFTDFAIGILNECYSINEEKTQNLLIRELSQWGKISCVEIAAKSGCERFISQTACQDLFKKIWMGEMTQDNSIFKLLICTAFPPLIPLLVKFKKNGDSEDALGENANRSSVQIKQKSKALPFGDKTNASLKQSPYFRQELWSTDDSRHKRKEEVKCFSWVKKFLAFFQSPVIIFCYNVASYMVFLCLYSYILISKLEENLSVEELLLIVWVFTFFTEEIRQVYTRTSWTIQTKFLSYIKDGWNITDVIAISLFVIGVILRSIPHPQSFEAARVVFGVNLVIFFIRLLHIFAVHKELGPKLVMIIRAVRSLISFFAILLVFIVAYAIASYAILYPKTDINIDTVIAIFRRPYWNIYGELMLDEIEGAADCTNVAELYGNGTHPRCPTVSGRYFVPLLMGLYMLMCNILLLNLLIVMFGYTFQAVHDNTDMHWNFQLHSLICDYYTRPILVPPLILISHLFELIRFIYRKCSHYYPQRRDAFLKHFLNEAELCQWEAAIADTIHTKRKLVEQETTDIVVRTTALRLGQLVNNFDQLVNNFDQLQEELEKRIVDVVQSSPIQHLPQTSNTVTEPDSTNLGQRMENIEKQLQWIVESLKEHHLGAKQEIPKVTGVRINDWEQEKKKGTETHALVYHMLEGEVKVHTRSRTSPYPGTKVHRFEVPNDKVPWHVAFPEYNPPTYISPEVSKSPDWADNVDLYQISLVQRSTLKFNNVDLITQTSRVSYIGNYQVQHGIPMNPIGRTGLQNRGILGRWGPNHVVDPVITRWKHDDTGKKMDEYGKPVFEFVAVRRMDSEHWALPESILAPGRLPTENLKFKFSEEALGSLGKDRRQKKKIKKQMEKILKNGKLIYQGYADDPRNTDNAWLESTVYLYQDEKDILRHFSLMAGGDHPATWLTASSKLSLYGAHSYFLKLVAERLGASF